MNESYLTPANLAEEIGISIRTLQRWNLTRKSPRHFKVGKRVLYRREAVDLWFRENESVAFGPRT